MAPITRPIAILTWTCLLDSIHWEPFQLIVSDCAETTTNVYRPVVLRFGQIVNIPVDTQELFELLTNETASIGICLLRQCVHSVLKVEKKCLDALTQAPLLAILPYFPPLLPDPDSPIGGVILLSLLLPSLSSLSKVGPQIQLGV